MMKKILLLATLFLFSGCLGDSEEISNFLEIKKNLFSVKIPQFWAEVSPSDFSEIPFSLKPEAIFRSLQESNGTFSNVVFTIEKIPNNISTVEFARSNLEKESVSFFNFQKISEEYLQLSGQQTIFIEFEGQVGLGKKNLRYLQSFLVTNGFGIAITGACEKNSDEDELNVLRKIIKNVNLN